MSAEWIQVLHEADGLLSLVAHRYSAALPEDVRVDCLAVSLKCRALAKCPADKPMGSCTPRCGDPACDEVVREDTA